MPLNAPASFETVKLRPRLLATLIAAGLYVCLGQGAVAQQTTDAIAPEAGTAGSSSEMRKAAAASNWMISAANPLAVEAGANILRSGGNAIDAMVTIQTMLGLVEPQSSGLGGGAFLVYFDAATGKLTTLDGRETAPLNATPTLFHDENGEPLKFYDAVVGGRSVGTPGTPALMKAAHEKWGQLSWKSLFDPAIDVATTGFEVSPRLAALIADDQEKLSRGPEAKGYFFDKDGAPLAAGTVLRNPKYAKTLQDLSVNGTVNFYQGQIAQNIVDKVKGASWNPGVLSLADFANYQVKERAAVCIEYRGHDVCGMGPPSSGALTVGQIPWTA